MKRTASLGWVLRMTGGLLLCAACAGNSNEGTGLSCGPGTRDEAGQCVPVRGRNDAGADGATPHLPGGGGSDGGGAEGAVGSRAPCDKTGHCPAVPMVKVEGTDGPYEVDPYEITIQEYALFLEDARKGFVSTQTDEVCSWNTTFEASEHCRKFSDPSSSPWRCFDGVTATCLDFCDARAYCAWAGKRLCTFDEWYNACSEGGTDDDAWGRPAGDCSHDDPCESAPGLYNMAESLYEWVEGECELDSERGWICEYYGSGYSGASCGVSSAGDAVEQVWMSGRCCR